MTTPDLETMIAAHHTFPKGLSFFGGMKYMFSLPAGKALATALSVYAIMLLPMYKAATTNEELKSCTISWR